MAEASLSRAQPARSLLLVLPKMADGRMLVEFHGGTLSQYTLVVYANIFPKKRGDNLFADQARDLPSFLADWSSAATSSAPSMALASCWPFSQAGIALSKSRLP